jgi:hypothetical protein
MDPPAEPAPAPAQDAPPAEAPPPAAADPKADRAARIKALQEREREAERRRSEDRRAKAAQPDPAIAERAAKAERLERELGMGIDELLAATSSEAMFFKTAQRRGMTPQRLAEHLRDRLADPAKQAADEAEVAMTPIQRKLDELERRAGERIAALEHEIGRRDQDAREAQAAAALVADARAQARTSPLAAAFLEKRGEEAFVELATAIANAMPPHSGLQAVLDMVEHNLEQLAEVFRSSTETKQPSQPRAAAKAATTVTNSIASRRSTIADEDAEFAALPLEERLALLKRRHG